jgi:hypothetical protein
MQLRYLAALFDIASDRTSTVVFPFPIELAQVLRGQGVDAQGLSAAAPGAAAPRT